MARRPRIYEDEVNPVMKAIHYRLSILVENDDLEDETSALFNIFWRFELHRTGPPSHPEFNRESVEKTAYAGHSSADRKVI